MCIIIVNMNLFSNHRRSTDTAATNAPATDIAVVSFEALLVESDGGGVGVEVQSISSRGASERSSIMPMTQVASLLPAPPVGWDPSSLPSCTMTARPCMTVNEIHVIMCHVSCA